MKRVTLKDIAQAAGVSVATVSLALRDDKRITQTVREKIQNTAQELGYEIDLLGSMLRANNPRIIGVVAELSQELHQAYVREIVAAAKEQDYHVIVEDISIRGSIAEAYQALSGLHVRHVIAVNPPLYSQEHALVPCVAIGQEAPAAGIDLITSDNYDGMEQLLAHLNERGCKKIFYLDGPVGASAGARLEAFQTQAQKLQVSYEIWAAGNDMDSGYQSTCALLDSYPEVFSRAPELETNSANPPENFTQAGGKIRAEIGLVCYNDQCAQGALMALYRAGVKVPETVLVAGFDNSFLAGSETFALTSVDRNVKEIATLALKQAISRHQGDRSATVSLRVATKLVVRKSTGVS